jgi:hypothetical protein
MSSPAGLTPTPKKRFRKGAEGAAKDVLSLVFASVVINGGTYCRRHLLICCDECGIDYKTLHDEANVLRIQHHVRPVGDSGLDAVSERIRDSMFADLCEFDADSEAQALATEAKAAPSAAAACTECAYYACVNPTAPNLSACNRCHVVKYCSKECQTQDWKWEHKYECVDPTGVNSTHL